jgi:hypothetical protein
VLFFQIPSARELAKIPHSNSQLHLALVAQDSPKLTRPVGIHLNGISGSVGAPCNNNLPRLRLDADVCYPLHAELSPARRLCRGAYCTTPLNLSASNGERCHKPLSLRSRIEIGPVSDAG